MDDKVKLYVFARKEVALIFVFMILTALTSFYFGVKVGKSFSFKSSGLTNADQAKVELLSGQEEQVQKIIEERPLKDDAMETEQVSKDSYQLLKEKINQEFKEESSTKDPKSSVQSKTETTADPPTASSEEKQDPAMPDEKVGKFYNETSSSGDKSVTSKYVGKYTIQLGSYPTKEEAEKFSDGFRVRGYTPIINEVILDSKGTWYRVNLGVFETLSEAKDYILKERSLFQGQDYVIGKFE